MKLLPLGDRIIVEPVKAETSTRGGIVLPDNAQERPQRGTVIAVGPGRVLDNGDLLEPSVEVGHEVIFGKYSGSDFEFEGKKVKILSEQEIFAIVSYYDFERQGQVDNE